MNDLYSRKRFFITHSHADNAFAKRLADDLSRLGLDGFFDIYSLRLGDNVPAHVNKGLAECDVYVPVLSHAALESPWCEEEISTAITLSRMRERYGRPRIIPVLIEDCKERIASQYPSLLTRLYVSFVGRYDEALRELVVRGFDLPLDDTIPNRLAEPIRFVPVPLIETGLANADLSTYRRPPFGDCFWFGIPFKLQNARISMADTFDSQSKSLNLVEHVSGVQAVYFLINAGDGRRRYLGREIGWIDLNYEKDDPPQARCLITLGQNVREWAIGNYVHLSATDHRPDQLVGTLEDSNTREVWRGETQNGQVAVIDMLIMRVDERKLSKRLQSIVFVRTIPRNTIALDYFISGITIETSAT